MKRIIQNEKGYTLFMALLVAILFIVVATSLLTVTMSGLAKNTSREEITQATELAEKGIQHLVKQINQELQDKLGEDGLTSNLFKTELVSALEKYACDSNPVQVETETGKYEVCVESFENTINEDGTPNDLRKLVAFKSNGIVESRNEEVLARIEVGAQAVPDSLNYAIGAFRSCVDDRNCIPGEGNLFLHGASSIEGDMKVDGDLITTNRGYAYLGGDRWLRSLYPSAQPGPGNKTAKLVLGGDMYTFNHTPRYNTHITTNDFNFRYHKTNDPQDLFEDNASPQLVMREPNREKIEITDQKENFQYKRNTPGVTSIKGLSIQGEKRPTQKVFPYYERCNLFLGCSDETDGHFRMSGNNIFGQFATDGDLTISSGKATFENGLYVNGNLTIGSSSSSSPSQRVEIDGPIYVNGNVLIHGADAKFNALIYANQSVRIEYSRINGLDKDGKEGSLIVFANDEIHISNNSLYEDEPSRIRGYFYSDNAFEMYGVGSNVRIEGGISARRITLNAIRGRAKTSHFNGSQRVRGDYYEGSNGQKSRESRLQVIYNPDIIETYSDLKQQEPIIYNVDPPLIRERK